MNSAFYQEKISKKILGYVPSLVLKHHMETKDSKKVTNQS